MAADKRRSFRKAHSVAIEIFGQDRQLLGFGRLLEYSETGASFIAEERLLSGNTVRLRMRIFEKGIIDVTARVIWRKPEGGLVLVGVRFDTVTRNYPTGSVD